MEKRAVPQHHFTSTGSRATLGLSVISDRSGEPGGSAGVRLAALPRSPSRDHVDRARFRTLSLLSMVIAFLPLPVILMVLCAVVRPGVRTIPADLPARITDAGGTSIARPGSGDGGGVAGPRRRPAGCLAGRSH